MATKNHDIKAVLLVGGQGTRLRTIVSGVPKPLARIGGRPFLELLVRQLRRQGIKELVFCVGYGADLVEKHFGDGRDLDVSISYSLEELPMGTGGALKLAEPKIGISHSFLVLNGDSFLQTDFPRLIQFHNENGGLVTMAIRHVENASRYGTVELDERGKIIRFAEKVGKREPGIINAGVYVFSRKALDLLPCGPFSLEAEGLPRLLDRGVFGVMEKGMFIDIGTPEDYGRALECIDELQKAALGLCVSSAKS